MYTNPYFYPRVPHAFSYYRLEGNELIHDLQKAINGEFSAIACYETLARLAPNKMTRNQILEIRNDEKRHLETFRRLYNQLTGKDAILELSEDCPDTYQNGLDFAFHDEQKTVDFYLEVADKNSDPAIKEAFSRAARDEQNHAVWFLYFMKS